MMAARSLELPQVPIKESWLLPPEQKKWRKKTHDSSNVWPNWRNRNPDSRWSLLTRKEKPSSTSRLIISSTKPLSESDKDILVESLTNHFPMRTNFTPGEPAGDERGVTAREWLDRRFATGPPKDEDIAKYRDREYPSWIRQCRKILSDLHKELQRRGQPVFELAVTNEGTRPRNDALVVIEALGNFKICPPPYRGEADDDPEEKLALPRRHDLQ